MRIRGRGTFYFTVWHFSEISDWLLVVNCHTGFDDIDTSFQLACMLLYTLVERRDKQNVVAIQQNICELACSRQNDKV